MIIFEILLFFILAFLLSFIAASIIININNYRLFRETFRLLRNGTYKFEHRYEDGTVILCRPEFFNIVTKDDIVFFGQGAIKLAGQMEYMHNAFCTYLDPVALFWFCRMWAWFNKNSHKFENN